MDSLGGVSGAEEGQSVFYSCGNAATPNKLLRKGSNASLPVHIELPGEKRSLKICLLVVRG